MGFNATARPATPPGAVLVAALFLLAAGSAPTPALGAKNVVVVMTDDQDARSLRVMKHTRRLIARRGTKFVNAYVTTPKCCPSRATFHTGLYTHNHGVIANDGPRGGARGFNRTIRPAKTLAVRLKRAGYRTGYVGKYINNPEGDGIFNVPRGWDQWFEMVSGTTYRMYDYVVNANGQARRYGSSRRDYQTDVLARRAGRFITQSAGARRPFFLMLGTVAPHRDARLGWRGSPVAAPRHASRFRHSRMRRSPSFNERNMRDKPRFIRRPRMRKSRRREIRTHYRRRLASLLAVDDGVKRIVKRLRRAGELRTTVLLFTSDNGSLLGEHRLLGKGRAYEEATRVPLLLRGPGIPRGKRRTQIVGNVDLAPTILDISRGRRHGMDGRSLLPLARNPSKGRGRALLIEVLKGSGDRPFRALRRGDYVLIDHRGPANELYDLDADPFQLVNRYKDPAYRPVRRELRPRLRALTNCRRRSCR